MLTHHMQQNIVSVYGLITKLFLQYLRKYIKVVGKQVVVHQMPRHKTTFILVPLSFDEERYWFFVLIASDSKDPWSPKEVWQRILRTYFSRFYPWIRQIMGSSAFRYIEGGTVLYIGAISRGCYSFGGKEIEPNVMLFTRDIRNLIRWLRTWNPTKIKEFFGDFVSAFEEFSFRLAQQVKHVFSALRKLFADKAELIERKSRMKDVEPYGPVKQKIVMLKTLSEVFEELVRYACGKPVVVM